MQSTSEFSIICSDTSKTPHYFAAFRHDSDHAPSWDETVGLCLEAWRLNAAAFRVEGTGFAPTGLLSALNQRGIEQLPPTPHEDLKIASDPYITDITEILALRLLKSQLPKAVFPHPRVIHKERPGLQHRGIDIVGFEESPGGTTLLIVEVMASVSAEHPPSVVEQHVSQILRRTLNESLPKRLLEELRFVHDECTDARHKAMLNAFIVAVSDGSLKKADGQRAVAILVRPLGMWLVSDWKPFYEKTAQFEHARIPATIWFGAIECDGHFSGLMDKIKDSVIPDGQEAR